MKSFNLLTRLWLSLLVALVTGAGIAGLTPVGSFLPGFLAASLLMWISIFCLLSAWHWAGGGRLLFWMVTLAFFLRLCLGIGLSLALPVYGYDEPTQKAGYLFFDAYKRDVESFDLTKSGASFLQTFTLEFDHDQYGGLLVVAGWVYMYLSPDAHRAFLILILGAFVAALGVPFLRKGLQLRWGERIANLAAWLVVFYPDGILYGSSQMREPFLIGLICIAIWGLIAWRLSRVKSIAALLLSLLGMTVISSKIMLPVAGVLAVWFYFEYFAGRSKAWRIAGYVALGLAGLALVYLSWGWLGTSSWYDLRLTVLNSGRLQDAIQNLQTGLKAPFLVVYGLTQPVLPAAIAHPTLAIWQAIAIFRALGWYALAPLLLYSSFTAWKAQPGVERRVLVWLSVAVIVWIVISSARAGGDQWDNPRYRTIFLPWMAILAAWGVERARQKRDIWLARWLLVECIFLAFFTNWYFSRYFNWWNRLPFWEMVAWILVLSGLVLASGWLWDLWKWWRGKTPPAKAVK